MAASLDPVSYTESWALAIPLTVPNKDELTAAYKAVWYHSALLYDNPLASSLTKRDRNRFVRDQLSAYAGLLNRYGLIETIVFLKKADSAFVRSFSVQDGRRVYTMDETITYTPVFRCAMTLVGRELDIAGRDGLVIEFIHEWLSYLSKIPLDRPDLEGPAETAWIERQVNPNPILATFNEIDVVRRVVAWLLSGFEPSFVGNHGPGTVAGGLKTVAEKNSDYSPTVQTQCLTAFHVEDRSYELADPRPGEFMLVAKDAKSLRSITREPTEMQFAQQGIKDDLYNMIDHDPDCNAGRFLRFSDQTPSQRCAIRGSLPGPDSKPSTIDSSNASDHLSVDLIAATFPSCLLHYVMAGRTWNVACGPNGENLVELSMYGGMGSALTFPVQSLFFLAVAIVGTISEHYLITMGVEGSADEILADYLGARGFNTPFAFLEKSVRVYGDDIAIPDFAAQRTIKLLGRLGLVVNLGKSFTGDSPFRESCGVDALWGRDITPQRYRIPSGGDLLDATSYEALRQHANAAFLRNRSTLNRACIRRVKREGKFIAGKELNRLSRRGSKYGYPKQSLGKPDLLFEEYRGPADYIGFVSLRPSKPTVSISLHERVLGYTTYFVEPETTVDNDSDYYHLTVNYREMAKQDGHSYQAHGSVALKSRLVKRNAIPAYPCPVNRTMVWGWAPR